MLVGDVLEVLGCALAAVATYLLILTLVGPMIALAGALFVVAAFLAYTAQGYATVQIPRPRLARPTIRIRRKTRDLDEADALEWLPDAVTFADFKHLLSMHNKTPFGTQLAKAELDRLRARNLVTLDGAQIKRVIPREVIISDSAQAS